jgi:ATP-dependent RNA helicase RhlE
VTKAEIYHIEKIEKLIREKIPVKKLPTEVEVTKTPFAESQAMALDIDWQKKKEDPEFKGAFHEKKNRA